MKTAFKALVGSHNYNLTNVHSDKDYKEFYFPSFDDLYGGNMGSISKKVNGNDVEYHDIRKLPQMLWKANVNFIEVLFSQEAQSNSNVYTELYEIRESIARMNLPYLYDACIGMMFSKLKDANRDSDYVDMRESDDSRKLKISKSLYQVARIRKFLFDYAATDFIDFQSSIFVDESDMQYDYLMRLKNGIIIPFIEVRSFQDAISLDKPDMKALKEKYKSQIKNEETHKDVEDIVKDYVRYELQAEFRGK